MRRHGLDETQLDALSDLAECWGTERFVLIGARALGCFVPLDWRQTEDLDVTVLTSLEACPAGLDRLRGWRQDSRITQRWHSPVGVRVDVLPVGQDGAPSHPIQWPGEDRILSMVGMRLVDEHAVEIAPRTGLALRVAPVPVIALLKMISYLDRPDERRRDLQDLAHVLVQYPDVESRFDRPSVFEHELDYDQSGPFLLGLEIAGLGLQPAEHDRLERFLALIESDDTVAGRMASEIANQNLDKTRRLVAALRLGLRADDG